MATTRFPGFPAQALKFFRDLEKHNDRDWFQEHKDIYETQVKAPMITALTAINESLLKFAPEYVTDPSQAIYRIYRDTRFSNDKTPYKTNIAATFRKRGFEKQSCGSLHFSVSHKEIFVAGGLYMPGPEQLIAVRNYLAEHHVRFRTVSGNAKLRKLMGDLQGEELKRVPKGFPAEHPAADLLRKKQWLYYQRLDQELATSPKLVPEVTTRFQALIPVLEFLNLPLGKRKVSAEELFG